MDRFEAMSVLVAAVENGSLSAASRKLRMPLPTVSRKVAELEARLHARLLTRSTRKLALTEAGRDYLAACKRILQDVAEAERAVTGEYSAPRGELAIAAPIVFGRMHLQPIVNEFLAAYADVDVRIAFGDRFVNFHEEHFDLAVRIGALPDSSLVASQVGASRIVVCASPAYFRRRGRPGNPADLAAHDCISFEGVTSARAWTFGRGAQAATVAVHSRLVVNTAEAAIDAACAGVGITRVLSYQIEPALRARKLALALREHEPEPRPVNLVHAGHQRMPLKLRAFIDFARPRLRERLGYRAAPRGG